MKQKKLMMIKFILIGVLFLTPIIKVRAQNSDMTSKQFDYCVIAFNSKGNKAKMIMVDFGKTQTLNKPEEIKLMTEELKNSKTKVDLLDIMDKEGWELIQAYGHAVSGFLWHDWIFRKQKIIN